MIEVATVLGWKCVVSKKDNFQVGDMVVYFEIDSIVPEKPEFEFLRSRKFRIKTIKLKQQISQGLIMPLSILPKATLIFEGSDVTDVLGVKKHDPEADAEQKLLESKINNTNNRITKVMSRYKWYRRLFLLKKKKEKFPKFIVKTNESRLQNMVNILEKHKDTVFDVREKLDGCSVSMFLIKNKKRFLWFGNPYVFGVCSRNIHLVKPDNSCYWEIARKYNIEKVLASLLKHHFIFKHDNYLVLQGEIIGEGIQKNKYKVKGYDFYAFNLISSSRKTSSLLAEGILECEGIKFVPLIDSKFKLKETIDEMVEYSKGKSKLYDTQREGIVVRNYDENISFKVINPDFLLKHNE
jgi:hypothetical protein